MSDTERGPLLAAGTSNESEKSENGCRQLCCYCCGCLTVLMVIILIISLFISVDLPALVELDNNLIFCPLPNGTFTPWPDPNYRLTKGAYLEGQKSDYYLYVHSYILEGVAPGLEHHVLSTSDAWEQISFFSDVLVWGEIYDPTWFRKLGIGYTASVGTALQGEPWTAHSHITGNKTERVRQPTPLISSMANGRFPFAHAASLNPAMFTVNFETPIVDLDLLSFDVPLIAENGIDPTTCEGVYVERVSFSKLRVSVREWMGFGLQRMVGCAWTSPCFRSNGATVP